MRTILVNCGPIVHLNGLIAGKLHSGPAIYSENVSSPGLSILVSDGIIKKIGEHEEVMEEITGSVFGKGEDDVSTISVSLIDVHGRAVIPSFVDSHTHLVWAGDRSNEHDLRCSGMSYAEISAQGGGILSTVSSTRLSTDEELYQLAAERLEQMLLHGTTYVEAKSGYGLSTEHELRLLAIAEKAIQSSPLRGQHTWLGAHALPPEYSNSSDSWLEYAKELVTQQLPAISSQGIARYADVFCEIGWFNPELTLMILEAAKSYGFKLRLHADEFQDSDAAEIGARVGASSVDHVGFTKKSSRELCASQGVVQTFLPGALYSMGLPLSNPKECLENNWPFGLATDFNPNCRIYSMPMIASLAMQQCGLPTLDTIVAMTHNPAVSLGLDNWAIKENQRAEILVLCGKSPSLIGLTPGSNPVEMIFSGKYMSISEKEDITVINLES